MSENMIKFSDIRGDLKKIFFLFVVWFILLEREKIHQRGYKYGNYRNTCENPWIMNKLWGLVNIIYCKLLLPELN